MWVRAKRRRRPALEGCRSLCARWSSRGAAWLLALLAGLASGCQSDSVPGTPPPAPGAFWSEQAALDFAALERIDDRSSGSRGARSARRRLRKSLEARGIETEEWSLLVTGDQAGYPDGGERELVTLVGKIPGESPDVFLLAAHYDTASMRDTETAAEDASGAALVLGLGRALLERRLPYTIWLAFIDGDSAPRGAAEGAIGRRFSGSAALVERLAERGELEHVRLAVFFRQVAGERLEIARDLHSHRVYREVFFESARDLGYEQVFGAGGRFVSGETGHRAFLARDLRQVVAITGRASSVPRSVEEANAKGVSPDPGSTVTLGIVGDVTLEALDRIAARLRRIDRFAEAPLQGRSEASNAADTGRGEDAEEADAAIDSSGAAADSSSSGAGSANGVDGPASGAD